MSNRTEFESDIMNVSQFLDIVKSATKNTKGSRDGIEILQQCKKIEDYLEKTIDMAIKYEQFLKMLKTKFAYNIDYNLFMNKITVLRNYLNQIRLNISNSEYEEIDKKIEAMIKECDVLRNSFAPILSVPYIIDYSKLSSSDWKLIGKPGMHYKSRIFLSYPFRNGIPKKDENQQLLDDYVIPLLEVVGIQPVSARLNLDYQKLIDDEVIDLVEFSDGIIGFFTKNDNVDNVEHELSRNNNIVAICKEEDAKAPSMRYSRLMINFDRSDMGSFLIELLKALKNNEMFYLKQK